MGNVSHKDVMAMLESIPAVKEETNSLRVQFAISILEQRLALNLTQEAVVRLISDGGDVITQATISKMENAEGDIKISSYEKVFKALDLHADVVSMRKKQIAIRQARSRGAVAAAIKAKQGIGKTYSVPQPLEVAPEVITSELVKHSKTGRVKRVSVASLARSKKSITRANKVGHNFHSTPFRAKKQSK